MSARTLVVACAAAFALLVAVDSWANGGGIHAGVEAGGVPLGGMTAGEAERILEERASGVLEGIRLEGASQPLRVRSEQLDLTFDARATAEEAYAVGRRGSIPQRLRERAATYLGTVPVPPRLVYDQEAVLARVGKIAASTDAAPRDADLIMEDGGEDARVIKARSGYELDVEATTESVREAVGSLSGEAKVVGRTLAPEVSDREAEEARERFESATAEPLVLGAGRERWTLSPSEVGRALVATPRDGSLALELDRARLRNSLSGMYEELDVEPVEAGFEMGDEGAVSVTAGRDGKKVDEDALYGAVEDGLSRGRHEYEVRAETVRPELTTAEAEEAKPTKLLGSYRTDYSVVPDDGSRVENLGISSGAVNGTLLAPGEVFSMLDYVVGLEYNDSKVIVGGEETTADGGGLCQVTSTLYNAANFAGLDVVERTPHSAQLPYIRPGMDATVWWGGPGAADDLDMKFRNTTEGYVYIRQYVADDGHVYAEIWGRPNGTEVEMRSEPAYMGADGSDWVTYQTVRRGGEVVFDGVLHRDSYEPLVDEQGEEIPPQDVPVAPVDP